MEIISQIALCCFSLPEQACSLKTSSLETTVDWVRQCSNLPSQTAGKRCDLENTPVSRYLGNRAHQKKISQSFARSQPSRVLALMNGAPAYIIARSQIGHRRRSHALNPDFLALQLLVLPPRHTFCYTTWLSQIHLAKARDFAEVIHNVSREQLFKLEDFIVKHQKSPTGTNQIQIGLP